MKILKTHLSPGRLSLFLLLIFSILILPEEAFAKKKKKKDKNKATATTEKKKAKTIPGITRSCEKKEGLFTLYQDTASGELYMLIDEGQFNQEYIYFSQVVDGVLDAGLNRGRYRGAKIFEVRRYFDRVEFVVKNTSYYFDEKNALSKAADANINAPVIFSEKVVAKNKEGKFLVKAAPLFLAESFQQIKPTPRSSGNSGRFTMGSLSKAKNKYLDIRNYEENTDVLVEYVYENQYPKSRGSNAVTDARFVSIKVLHSIIKVPENDFAPRYEDPRVGYFTHQKTDMTSVEVAPYRDVIHRWNLVKKDKGADMSEPVEPITWWIENTTPVELREIIKEGVLAWNIAFEKAGFKNAVVVKIQPDDAKWDAGDIRYNVLRWTSSPIPPFGGYGPSFVNPRTGQILGADIMLEYIYITNRMRTEQVFDIAGMEDLVDPVMGEEDNGYCSFSSAMQYSNLFGLQVMEAQGLSGIEKDEFIKQALYRLVLHEVGHTLGLNHNFKASCLHHPNEIHNKELTAKKGLTGSVMEYPAVNIAKDKSKQGQYFDVQPGQYDLWAIEFGYSEALEDAAAEKERLNTILNRSTEPALAFGNDADDMRAPGKGIDPRAMIYDLSSDPVAYSKGRMELINSMFPTLLEKQVAEGESYHKLRNAYFILTREYAISLMVVSRHIGGVYVDRSFAGQEGAGMPYTPLPYEAQKKAMDVLSEYAFGLNAFKQPTSLYNHIQIQRRGFNLGGWTEDPKLHDRVLNTQRMVLDQLVHMRVLQRISDTQLYGNKYSLNEYMGDLTDAIFAADKATSVTTIRQNVQSEYIERLINIVGERSQYDHLSKAEAYNQINRIERWMKQNSSGDASTKAHRKYMLHMIEKALKEN